MNRERDGNHAGHEGILTYHPGGEIPCRSVDFGARLDDAETQEKLNKGEIGALHRSPSGTEWQLIVKRIPTPLKVAAGVVTIGALIIGTYAAVRHELHRRDLDSLNKNQE